MVGSRVAITERIYWSRNHAQTAARSARDAGRLQERLMSQLHAFAQSWSREDLDTLWSHVTISVMSAAAALEAGVNELYGDASDISLQRPHYQHLLYATLDPGLASKLAFVWGIAERQADLVQRYQLALTIAGLERFDPGRAPLQDCSLMIRLRNYLTHAEPEWLGPGRKLDSQLASHFDISPLSHEGSPFVPYKALGYGCAVWAVTSTVSLIDAFFARIHLPSPLDLIRGSLDTAV